MLKQSINCYKDPDWLKLCFVLIHCVHEHAPDAGSRRLLQSKMWKEVLGMVCGVFMLQPKIAYSYIYKQGVGRKMKNVILGYIGVECIGLGSFSDLKFGHVFDLSSCQILMKARLCK